MRVDGGAFASSGLMPHKSDSASTFSVGEYVLQGHDLLKRLFPMIKQRPRKIRIRPNQHLNIRKLQIHNLLEQIEPTSTLDHTSAPLPNAHIRNAPLQS